MKPKHKLYWQARKHQAKLRSRKNSQRRYFGINWHPYKVELFNKTSFYRASEGCQTVIGKPIYDGMRLHTFFVGDELTAGIGKLPTLGLFHALRGIERPHFLDIESRHLIVGADTPKSPNIDLLTDRIDLDKVFQERRAERYKRIAESFELRLNREDLGLPPLLQNPQSDLHQSYLDSLLNAHKDEPDKDK